MALPIFSGEPTYDLPDSFRWQNISCKVGQMRSKQRKSLCFCAWWDRVLEPLVTMQRCIHCCGIFITDFVSVNSSKWTANFFTDNFLSVNCFKTALISIWQTLQTNVCTAKFIGTLEYLGAAVCRWPRSSKWQSNASFEFVLNFLRKWQNILSICTSCLSADSFRTLESSDSKEFVFVSPDNFPNQIIT